MNTTQTLVPCPYGQWTALCEQKYSRKSLLVCIQGADAVLGITTNAANVSTPFGVMPPGFFVSTSDGNGPSHFRLSEAIDGDAVHQEWFAWTLPATFTQVPITPGFATVDNVGGAPPTTVSVSYDLNTTNPTQLPADLIIVVVYSVLALTADVTVTSAFAGVLTRSAGAGTGDVTTYTTLAGLYWYLNTTGADTITVDSAADGAIQVEVYAVQYGTGPDQFGDQAGETPATLSLPDTPQSPTEIAFGAIIVDLAAVPDTPSGWTVSGYPQLSVALVAGPFWASQTVWQVVNTIGLITISNWVLNIGPVYGLAMGAWIYDLGALPAPVAAVLQSFDEETTVPVDEAATFVTGLPKLTPGGAAALNRILKVAGINEQEPLDEDPDQEV